jgi:hypothetical protein
MLSRREFLSGASTLTIASVISTAAGADVSFEARFQGFGRTVMNAIGGYANLAKGFVFSSDPTNADAKGYPINTPLVPWIANPSMPIGYFGDYVFKFKGRGSMQFSPCAIIRSGGANIVNVAKDFGDTGGNTTILDKSNPRVVLAFGAFIQNISQSPESNGAGGRRIRLTFKPGYANSMSLVVRVQALDHHGQSAALGIWNCARIDGNTLDLISNVTTGMPSTWDSRDPYIGPGGEAISQASDVAVYILNQGSFSKFADLVFCKLGNETLVDAGKIVDPDLIAQLQYEKPAWLRFMDLSAVQASYENDFPRRVPITNLYYPGSSGRYVPDYWVGTITRRADDTYTCANPIASGGGGYVDNESRSGHHRLSERWK